MSRLFYTFQVNGGQMILSIYFSSRDCIRNPSFVFCVRHHKQLALETLVDDKSSGIDGENIGATGNSKEVYFIATHAILRFELSLVCALLLISIATLNSQLSKNRITGVQFHEQIKRLRDCNNDDLYSSTSLCSFRYLNRDVENNFIPTF